MAKSKLTVFNDPFDTLLPQPNPTIQRRRVDSHPGTINQVKQLTYDTFEVTVNYTADQGFINAKAGQYGTLQVPGIKRPRAYSFAKTPELENPNEVTFFIRLVEGGELSAWLQDKDRTGEKVTVSGPMGHFGLDNSHKTIVCIAGGSGMSAIKAIVEHACQQSLARDCYFFYGARTQADLYCLDEMADLAKKWNPKHHFEFIPVLSEEPEDSNWQGPKGFVTEYFNEHYLANKKFDVNNVSAFFCGPPPMIDHGVEVLTEVGLSSRDIRYDKFEDVRSPAPVVDNTKCVLCDECLLVKPVENCIVEATGFTLSGIGKNRKVSEFKTIQPGQTSGLYYNSLFIDDSECIRCYACIDACPHDAISPQNKAIPKTLKEL